LSVIRKFGLAELPKIAFSRCQLTSFLKTATVGVNADQYY